MSKIRLEVDRLHVESFEPAPQDEVLRGTVHGHGTAQGGPCFATETRALQLTTCVETYNTCARTCLGLNCNGCEPDPTSDCPTEHHDVNTCGESCVQLCFPDTRQLIACTAD